MSLNLSCMKITSWWFQPSWKHMLVQMGSCLPRIGLNINKNIWVATAQNFNFQGWSYTIWRCDSYWTCGCSIAMLGFRGVCTFCLDASFVGSSHMAEPGDSHSINTKNCSAQKSQLLKWFHQKSGGKISPGWGREVGSWNLSHLFIYDFYRVLHTYQLVQGFWISWYGTW